MRLLRGLSLALVAVCAASPAAAELSYRPAQFDLSDDGEQFIRFITWHQVWARYTQLNPGTTVRGEAADEHLDIGMRRSRFLVLGKLAPRLLILSHFGFDNQTFASGRKPQLFMHDAWVEYEAVEDALFLGGGLIYHSGPSRMSSASTLNFLALDAPIHNWPTIERSDQFGRQYGFYAKGRVAGLDYRLAVTDPFSVDATPSAVGDYNPAASGLAFGGYVSYAIFDAEPNTLPYTTGTWLGAKKVLNIGAGAHYQPDGIRHLDADGEAVDSDLLAAAVDVFADLPLGEGSALTAYAAFHLYDFGPNNLRNIGIMNVGDAGSGTSANGAGNAYPVLGTGTQLYAQAGYLLPFKVGRTQYQPYAAVTYGDFEALDDPATTLDAGLNIYLFGHSAKCTLHYRSRPIFEAGDGAITADDRASEVIFQTQFFL